VFDWVSFWFWILQRRQTLRDFKRIRGVGAGGERGRSGGSAAGVSQSMGWSDRQRPRREASGACRCFRVFLGHLFSNLGLFAIVVGYVLLGALMFEALEAEFELQQRANIKRFRDDCLTELWLITGKNCKLLYISNYLPFLRINFISTVHCKF